jgi:hypothetical protein
VAETVEVVVPGVWRWHDLGRSHRLRERRARRFGRRRHRPDRSSAPSGERAQEARTAICLTAACHQRSAWQYRGAYGVQVYAPEGCRAMDEEPDVRYREREMLPGGPKAIHTPGPDQAQYALAGANAGSALLPGSHHPRGVHPGEIPRRSRCYPRERARLPALSFEVLCMDHGAPITANPHAALQKLLG